MGHFQQLLHLMEGASYVSHLQKGTYESKYSLS